MKYNLPIVDNALTPSSQHSGWMAPCETIEGLIKKVGKFDDFNVLVPR